MRCLLFLHMLACATSEAVDYSSYKGVRIENEKSLLSFGAKEDVKLVRTGPKQLQVIADSVNVPAKFNVGTLSIEDLILKTVMDKIKPHIMLCQPGWDGPWCAKACAKKPNEYFTSGLKTGKNCGVATCGSVPSCGTGVTCTSATNQQCSKCSNGYYLTNAVKDTCTKCPVGYSCDGSTTKTLVGSSKLVDLGGSAHTIGKLQKCQGDCDNDSQCATGLKCFQRDKSTQQVPGCWVGGDGDIGTHDYCYDPSPLQDLGGSAHTKGQLDICQGDCDSDAHCLKGLKCFQRDKSSQAVPGCPPGGSGDLGTHDYCYLPLITPDHEWTFDSKTPKSSQGNLKYSYHSKEPNWINDNERGGIVGDFNGANTCIDVHDTSGLFSVSKFTLSFFFKADKLSGTQGVVAHGESFKSDKAYWVLRLTGTKLQLWVEATNDGDYHLNSKDLKTNKWYHVILVKDNRSFKMYIDGTVHASSSNLYGKDSPGYQEHQPLSIGCRTNSGNRYQDYFDGKIDHVQFFKKVYTPKDLGY